MPSGVHMIKHTVGSVYHDMHISKTRLRTQIKNEKTFYALYCQQAVEIKLVSVLIREITSMR